MHSIKKRKGGIILSAIGYIQVHVYTSQAQIPLPDTAVAITDIDGSAIALRLTDRSGTLELPLEIPAPDLSAGLVPTTGILPFSVVNIYAKKEGYQEIMVKNLQVFPNTVTRQNLELIPMPEYPRSWNKTEVFDTPAQNL